MSLSEIINIVVTLIGGGALITIWVSWKSRRAAVNIIHSEAKGKEVTALEGIQQLYDKFVEQTNKKFDELEKTIQEQNLELEQLRKDLKNQLRKCLNCNNNKL